MKKEKICRFFAFMFFAAGCCLGSGCEFIKEVMQEDLEYSSENPNSDDYDPHFVIGMFSIVRYPRATTLEKEVTLDDGSSVWINTNQHFDSKRIKEARVIPRPGDPDRCDLQLRLDRTGKSRWQMLVAASRGEPVALVIDNRYVGNFIPELPKSDAKLDWVFVRIGIDSYTARGVAKYAKKNYVYYNPSAADWFRF